MHQHHGGHSRMRSRPAQVLVLGFAVVIIAGAALLILPAASSDGVSRGLSTALFTATSAVCVTGLIVVDTGTAWSPFGQAVIAVLIQVGGLGIMTMTTLFALLLGRRIGLRDRVMIKEATGWLTLSGTVSLVRHILLFTLAFEAVGAVLYTIRFAGDYPVGRALALGVFHSVSAFNNAGFSLFETSFMNYVTDPVINLVSIVLIVSGGLGFLVMLDGWNRLHGKARMSLHSRVVLVVTAILLILGTVVILAFEWTNPATLAGLGLPGRFMAALFHSVTPRTAGFNTLPTGELRTATQWVTMGLMFVGGSSNSTAGGIKTTTLVLLLAAVASTVRGRGQVELFERRLPRDLVDKALAVALISFFVVGAGALALMLTQRMEALPILFEVTSAFGTVGLSTGVTPDLSPVGRLVVILLMFTGRLGPVTLALAIGTQPRMPSQLKYPEEKIIVG